ncbi:hypothetical protein ACIBO1_09335 [Micromonospora sp. NPDC049903]|uniref:hypothetical protein n=1 Tax=Micromonospora sp. NPDC049903 TaxID=3364276 RepID=UPI0037B22131
MTGDSRVIDLDEVPPAAGTVRVSRDRRPSRRRTTLYVLAAFAVGMAVSGLGAREARDVHPEPERPQIVALVSHPGQSRGVISSGSDRVELDAQIMVVNAGTVPLRVRVLDSDLPGLQMRGGSPVSALRPTEAVAIDVRVLIPCTTALGVGPEPLYVRFSVQDESALISEQQQPLAFQGSIWQEQARRSCTPPAGVASD